MIIYWYAFSIPFTLIALLLLQCKLGSGIWYFYLDDFVRVFE